ncbi:MAG: hypothetical protein ABIP53_01925, partial [Candidatus Limnocylindrales bacterium]
DFAVAHHARIAPLHDLVASLVPLYFGRVASLIVETSDLTTDEAEAFVERQADAFEASKSYLMARWSAAPGPAARLSVGAVAAAR